MILVDKRDEHLLRSFRWRGHSRGYVAAKIDGKEVLLHRLIMDPPPGMTVDHLDGNKENNRRSNLRVATYSQNCQNTGPRRRRKFKGVTWSKAARKWQAQIMVMRRQVYLGLHESEIEAAKAYNRAAVKHFGAEAWTNDV